MIRILQLTYKVESDRARGQYNVDRVIVDEDAFKNRFSTTAMASKRKTIEEAQTPEARSRSGAVPRDVRVWEAIARTVIELDADPAAFMRSQFLCRDVLARPLMPENLHGPAAVAQYHKSPRMKIGQLKNELMSHWEIFRIQVGLKQNAKLCRLTPEQSWAAVLSDPELGMSVLFRYCMGFRILNASVPPKHPPSFTRICADCLLEAADQYMSAPDCYDEAWKPFLPPGWRSFAEKQYEMIYTKPSEQGGADATDI